MGSTYAKGSVRRTDAQGSPVSVQFLVDTGAIYTVLPRGVCAALGLTTERTVEFTLADGSSITRGVAECRFDLMGVAATSPVILGEATDAPLLGSVTLETLGMMVNPLTREVTPMRLVLASVNIRHEGPSNTALRACPIMLDRLEHTAPLTS